MLITINIGHWRHAEGLLPWAVLLHEVAHAVAYAHEDYDGLGHNSDFRGLLMKAHLRFNPYFTYEHVERACEIADLIGIAVTECDVRLPPTFSHAASQTQCATERGDEWADWHECHVHRDDGGGPSVQLSCREGFDVLFLKTDDTAWRMQSVTEAQAQLRFNVGHGHFALDYLAKACGTPEPGLDCLYSTEVTEEGLPP